MSENDDRLSAPPPGEDWVAPDTLAGDLTLTAEQYLERVSSIPAEPVIATSPPQDPLAPGPDGLIPGSRLNEVLKSIQEKLDKVLGNHELLWDEVGKLRNGLDQVKTIALGSKEIVTKLADNALAETTMFESLRDKVDVMDQRLACPQEKCMVWKMIGRQLPDGSPGE